MADKQGRPLYKRTWFRVGLSLMLISSLSLRIYYETNTFKINNVQFESSKLPEDFQLRIVQLTDVHNKVFPDQNQKLLKEIKH